MLLVGLLAACGSVSGDGGPEAEPLAVSVSAEPTSVEVGGTVALTATVSGEGAEPSVVTWSAAEGSLSADVGATVTWTAPATAGTYEVTAALTGGGSTVTATASVEVTPATTEPAGLSVSVVGNTEAVYGETVTLTAVVSGEGADAATVSWDATAGVLSSATGLDTEWTAPTAAGPVTLTASIDGHEVTGALEVDVRLCDAGDWAEAAEPCLISSVVQLQAIHEHLDGHFALGADLDANGTATWHDGAGFLPIGAGVAGGFRGSLDGGGHAISGLHIDRTDLHDVGLFAVIGTGGEVSDLNLLVLDVVGQGYTGGLAGHNRGVISSVHSAGTVTGEVLPAPSVGSTLAGSLATIPAACMIPRAKLRSVSLCPSRSTRPQPALADSWVVTTASASSADRSRGALACTARQTSRAATPAGWWLPIGGPSRTPTASVPWRQIPATLEV